MKPDTVDLVLDLFTRLVNQSQELWVKVKAAEDVLGHSPDYTKYMAAQTRARGNQDVLAGRQEIDKLLQSLRTTLLQDQ